MIRLYVFLGITLIASHLPLTGQKTISGEIKSVDGEPLIGATIQVKNSTTGTTSDSDGRFRLEIPDSVTAPLLISYVGYRSLEIPSVANNDLSVTLQASVEQFDEVVVVGFGSQSRKKITGSISKIEQDAFQNMPMPNYQAALQGKAAGVVVTQGSGLLGAQTAIRIRGVSSALAGNQPLFVIDGTVMGDIRGFGLSGPGITTMANLNPNDIESVEILKDASASAIYGARAANGVILITTKRGEFNTQPRVSIGASLGWSEPTAVYDLLDGQEYATLWNRAASAIGLDSNSGLFYNVAEQPNTDWFDLIYRKGFVQDYQASVSGGSKGTKYFVGGSYRNEESYIITLGLKRYSFRINLDQKIGERVRVGVSLNPSRTENLRAFEGAQPSNFPNPQSDGALFFPNVEAYDENGNLSGGILQTDLGIRQQPGSPLVNLLESNFDFITDLFLINTYLEGDLLKGLTFRTEFGSEYNNTSAFVKASSRTARGYPNGYGFAASTPILIYNWNNQLTFRNSFSRQVDLEVTAGTQLTRQNVKQILIEGNTFPDDRLQFLDAAANIVDGFSFQTDYGFFGVFGRANLTIRNRYLLNFSARYDGSSRFGRNSRYGFFPALSAGWILSSEGFFTSNWINFLKIRASYGLTGNAEIGNFAARGQAAFGFDYNGQPGSRQVSLENENLEWEKNRQMDVGMEIGLWDNRLSLTMDYFIRDTRDMLLSIPLSTTNGFFSTLQNAGSLRNQGFEFDLNATLIQTSKFAWSINLNFATLKNEITSLADITGDGVEDDFLFPFTIRRIGESLDSWYLVPYAGVDPDNGDALFYDQEGNPSPVFDPANRKINAKSIPDFTGGISTNFKIYGFDLSAFFQWATGHSIYNFDWEFIATNMGRPPVNQLRTQLNAWTPENPNTNVPEARLGSVNGNQSSTRYLDKGDYLRLRNLQFGYTFSRLWRPGTSLRVYASIQNLLTWTAFDGLDPEASRTNAGFVNTSFTLFSAPQSRTFTFGINLSI